MHKSNRKKGIIEQKLVDQMNREIEIMYILNHPHCLRLKNHFEDDINFYLVMPLATKGQLYKILRRYRKFDERTAAQILRETISALQYLHSFKPPIIHRDIKPENLVFDEKGYLHITDFGIAKISSEDNLNEIKTKDNNDYHNFNKIIDENLQFLKKGLYYYRWVFRLEVFL